MVKKIRVIVNPAAGQDKPFIGIMNKAFRDSGIDWDILLTHQAGDARRLAQQAVNMGAEVVGVYGGDGTVMEVASALIGSDIPMAIIPGGTANVMSVELGIPGDLAHAVELICTDDSIMRKIDMGQVRDKDYFILRTTIGLTADMIQGADREAKNRVGSLAYLLSAFQVLRDPQTALYQLTLDGKMVECSGIACVVANSSNLGLPGLSLAQAVDVSDGLLDVIVIHNADVGSLLSVAASVVMRNENSSQIEHWQAREITVTTDQPQTVEADGEVIETTPLTAKVIPQAIKVLVPKPKAL